MSGIYNSQWYFLNLSLIKAAYPSSYQLLFLYERTWANLLSNFLSNKGLKSIFLNHLKLKLTINFNPFILKVAVDPAGNYLVVDGVLNKVTMKILNIFTFIKYAAPPPLFSNIKFGIWYIWNINSANEKCFNFLLCTLHLV